MSIYFSFLVTDNVKVLCAVGDFGNGTFDLPQKPDRSTDVQLTTSAPIAQSTCYTLGRLFSRNLISSTNKKRKNERWKNKTFKYGLLRLYEAV